MEDKIGFLSGTLHIEGLLNQNRGGRGVVVAHPHPLYGGNMHDFVVESIANAFWDSGYSTLKFNFRGVGKSQGKFDNGIGEQSDLISAIHYLFGLGITEVDLAGYSFGTWVISRIEPDSAHIGQVVFVSPPFGLMDFEASFLVKRLSLVATGNLDPFSPPDLVRKKLAQWNCSAKLEVIAGSDHFYGGYHVTLESIIFAHLNLNP
jgi:uncharacterized protein